MRHHGAHSAEVSDTAPTAAARYWARVRETAPADRLRRSFQLSESVRTLTLSDVRRHAGSVGEAEVARRFVRRVYGADVADSADDIAFSTVSLEPTLAVIARTFRAAHVSHCIVGALASSWNGAPRATNDVDLLVDVDAGRLVSLLSARFTRVVASDAMAADLGDCERVTLLDSLTLAKVDVFCAADAEGHLLTLARAGLHEVILDGDACELAVAGAEDILLANLRWYRHCGERSDVSWRDAHAVRAVNLALDETYLTSRAAAEGIGDLLARLSSRST